MFVSRYANSVAPKILHELVCSINISWKAMDKKLIMNKYVVQRFTRFQTRMD